MQIPSSLIICLTLMLAAGCQGNIHETGPAPDPSSNRGGTQLSPTLATALDPGVQDLIDKAVSDLAQRLSIPAAKIKLLEATSVVWPDSSLGCPQPGMEYKQVSTSGFLIYVESGGTAYEYHADFKEQVILCEDSETPISPVKPGTIQDGQPWMPP